MKGDPALVVGLVDAGSVLHQERHHVHVVVYACLGEGRKEKEERNETTASQFGSNAYTKHVKEGWSAP